MKVNKIIEDTEFKPFKIELTIETQEEADLLHKLASYDVTIPHDVMRLNKDEDILCIEIFFKQLRMALM